MADKIELPDYLKGLVDNTTNNLITNTGGAPRISLKGRQFRFKKDGEEETKTPGPIHIIILGVVPEHGLAKTFYISGYTPDSSDPPDCSSFLGVKPDEWVDSPQAENCSVCPNNKWGSATSMSGGKSKACKESKRLMVIRAEEAKSETPTVYVLTVTVASLKALSEYGKFLVSNSLPMAAVVTECEFVDSDFPQVDFKFKLVLKEDIGIKMLEMSTEKAWMQNIDVKALSAPEQSKALPEPPPQTQKSKPKDNKSKDVGDVSSDVADYLNNWGAIS